MKITYTPNPLNTIIELDEHEQKELWYKIKVNEMEEMLSMAEHYVTEKYLNLDEAREQLDSSYYFADDSGKSKLDERCDTLLEHFLQELKSNHIGDCTCIACSCSKCHAESILGIDTIPGLSKYTGHNIRNAFIIKVGDKYESRTLDEALEKLSKFEIDPENYNTESWKKIGGYEQYLPKWQKDQEIAYQWLLNYKNQHFKD